MKKHWAQIVIAVILLLLFLWSPAAPGQVTATLGGTPITFTGSM